MDVTVFKQLPIMGILRGIEEDIIEPLVESVVSAGLKTLEITMNTANASELIKRMVRVSNHRLTIGAGTVLSMNELYSALDAGATFIVLPAMIQNVVQFCTKKGIPVFPGALTPQEVYTAWDFNPTMIKIFPAKFFGPDYIKELKSPFQNMEFLACGGITKENIVSFFKAGASAVAFGASIFKKDYLKERNFLSISEAIKSLIDAYNETVTKCCFCHYPA